MASAKATADEEEASKASGGGGGPEEPSRGGRGGRRRVLRLLRCSGASLEAPGAASTRSGRLSGGETPSLQGPRPRVESRSAVVRQAAAGGMPLGLKRGRFQRESRRREASMPERFFSFSALSLWEASELGVRATAPRRRGCRFRPQPYTLSFPFDCCGFEKVLLNMARTTCCLILQLESHSRQQVEKKRLSR